MTIITDLPIKVRPEHERDTTAWALWRLMTAANKASDPKSCRPYAIRNLVMALYDGGRFPVALSVVLPHFMQSEMRDVLTLMEAFSQKHRHLPPERYFERGEEIFQALAARMSSE